MRYPPAAEFQGVLDDDRGQHGQTVVSQMDGHLASCLLRDQIRFRVDHP
jgi:hypothetical protein